MSSSSSNNTNTLNSKPAAAPYAQHFEGLESRFMLSGQSPASADSALAYDSQGNLHVAYYDTAAHDLKYAMQSADGTWSAPITVDSSSNDVGQQVSLALDKNGLPAIAYRDAAKQDLKYAHFDGSHWTVSTVDSKKNTGVNPSLAFDSQNHALITYYRPSAKNLELATLNGKKWTFTSISKGNTSGTFSSAAINPATGKLAIAFEGVDGKVRYVEQSGKKFSKPVVVDAIAKSGGNLSLSFSSGNKAAFSYYDPNTGAIKLAVKNGKTFTVNKITNVTPGTDPGVKVAIDPITGKPEVIYYDANGGGVFVAKDGVVTLASTGGSPGTTAIVDPTTGKLIFTEVSDDGTPEVHDTRVIPAAPSGVTATAVNATCIDVAWSDNSDNEAGFLIERSTDGVNFTALTTTAANATSYSDTSALESTSYTYRVTAVGPTGITTVAGATASATTVPAGPTNLTASASTPTTVNLAWSDKSSGETGYRIERSSDGGSTFTTLTTAAAGVTSYQDTTAGEGSSYVYRVTATGAAGNSTVAIATVTTVVAAPSGLAAVSISAGQVNLAWTDNSSHETGFVIERSDDGGNTFTQIGTVSANAHVFVDSTVDAGAEYVYRVKATGTAGGSTYATSAAADVIPAAPTVTATALSTTNVTLSWSAVSGATSYVVERSDDGGDTFNILGEVSDPGYSDTSAVESSSYQYRVRAINAGGESANSTVATATTFLPAPSDLTASTISSSTIELDWTDNSDTETGFSIERSDDNGETFTVIASVDADTTSYQDTTAAEGATYVYRIQGVKGEHNSDYTQTASATTTMIAPTNLTVTASSLTQVDITWDDNSSAETGYEIYRSTDGGEIFTLLTTTDADVASFSDATVAEGHSYIYNIRAINDITASDYTSNQSVTTKPAAPTGLTATTVSDSQIDLSWTDNSSGETGYKVMRSSDGGTTWAQLGSTLAANTTSFSDTTAIEGSSYTYEIIATNSAGDSAASNTSTAVALAAAPTNLVATVTSSTSVHLTWNDNSNNELAYVVERSDDGGETFSAVSTILDADTSSFDDTTADAGTSYVYRVLALNTASATSDSNTQSVLTLPADPAAPTASVTGATSVHITWTAVTGADTYLVEVSADAGSAWTTVGTTSSTSTDDNSATEGGSFIYRVTAHNATGDSSASATSSSVTTLPAAPTNLVATPISAGEVDLAWTDNSGHETGFVIERSSDAGSTWTTIHTGAADEESYADTGVTGGTNNLYRIRATGVAGDTATLFSNYALTVPSAVTNVAATTTSASATHITWTDTTGETGYLVEHSSDGGTTWSTVANLPPDSTSTNDTGLSEGVTYTYRVTASNGTGSSAASNTSAVDTLVAGPTSNAATPISATRVDLTWTDNSSHETGYRVERSSDNGTTWAQVGSTLAADTTSYSDTTTSAATSYQYRVIAIGTAGDSAASNTVTALTVPAAPGSAGAVASADTHVSLSWTAVTGATGYSIERSDDSGSTWNTPVAVGNVLSYADSSALEGTYYVYRVSATNATGASVPSSTTSVTTLPAAATNLTKTIVSATRVDLVWTDNSGGETGYLIERSSNDGTNYTPLTVLVPNSTTYSDMTAAEATNYVYRVKPVDITGTGAGVTVNALTVPAAPDTLVATPINDGEVDLTWHDNSAGETGFVIERSDDAGSTWTTVTTTAANATSYHDTGVSGGVTYTYRVSAINTSGSSTLSNTPTALTIPARIFDLTSTVISDTEIDLTWTGVVGEDSYELESSTDGGTTWNHVASPNPGDTSYSDTGLTEVTQYMYRIVAINATGANAPGNFPTATTAATAPDTLVATPINDGEVDLTWHDNSAAETGYVIERSDDAGDTWNSIHTTAADATSYADTSVTGGISYQYRVFAISAGPNTAPTNTATALTIPARIFDLTPTVVSSTQIDLTWTGVVGETTYELESSTDGGTNWNHVASPAPGDTSYSDTGLTEGTTYMYRIVASNGTGANAPGNFPTATTLPAAPDTLVAIPESATEVDLSWHDNSSNETGYVIERSDDGGDTWNSIHTTAANATSYNDTSVTGGVTYIYCVHATANGSDSADSNTQNVLTYPNQVTGLTATPVSSTQIDLSWTAVDSAGNYIIESSTDAGSTWNTVATIGAITSYSDTSVSEATAYLYRVTAHNPTGVSATSATQPATTFPAAPTTLSATDIDAGEINLAWTDNSAGETGYKVQRSDDGGETWTTIHTTAANATTYADTSVSGGTTYLYQVLATDAGGDSDASNTDSALTIPDQITGLNATCNSPTEIDFTWTPVTGAVSYTAEVSNDGGSTWNFVTLLSDPSFNAILLTEGTTYDYRFFASNIAGDGVPTAATVTTIPAAPTDLTATATGATQVDLAWTDNSANESGYDIYRSDDGGMTWTNIHSIAADSTTYSDTSAPEDAALKYKVVATGGGGDSADSNVSDATTPIAAPTVLTATPTSNSSVDLSWTDNSTVETGYKIERSTDGGTTWTSVITTAANATTYTDTGLTEDTTYTYRVTATDGTVDSDASNTASAQTALIAPTDTAAVSTTATQVDITWTDNSSAETGYKVERSDDGGSTWSVIATTAANATSYSDPTAVEGTAYQYRVRASDAGNYSTYDSAVSLTTLPASPTFVTGTPFSTIQIDLTWADNSAHESGYVVERSTDGGETWTDIQTLPADSTTYSDSGLTEATDYEYRVRATSSITADSLESDPSSAVATNPNDATSLTSTVVSANKIDLAWTDNSNGETTFAIERSTDNGNTFSPLTTVDANTTTYQDTSAAEATAYVYRVRAERNGSHSYWSNYTTQITTLPAAATDLSVTTPTNTRAVLTWTDNSSGETGYKVQRSTDGGDTWTTINTTIANVTTYSDNTITEGGSYTYRVISFNTTGDGVASNAPTVSVVPASPTGLSGSAANPTRIDLTWIDHSSYESGFYVERSSNGGSTWTVIATLDPNTTSYSDTTVTEAHNFQYRVRAFNTGGNSGYTASVSITTPLIAPSNIAAVTVTPTRVDITWADNSSSESQYKVERSADGGSTWTVIATTVANVTSYSDTTVTEATAYLYRVRAAKTGNTSTYTSNASITTLAAAPTSLTATVASDTQVNLAWTDNSSGETGFVVERSSDGGSTWTQVGSTLAANTVSYNDTTASEGSAYLYRVKAVNTGGSSTYATSASVTTLPAAPSNLAATSPDANTVTLTWTDNSTHETGFKIERSDDGGSTWNQINTVAADTTTYDDTTVEEGSTYQYRVRANLSAANSAYSSTQTVTTVPMGPDSLTASVISSTEVDLTWDDLSAGETSYKIERSDDGGITFTEIASVAADTTTYNDTTASEGLYYQYRVRASNAGGYSGFSPSAEALTLPADPSNLAATVASSTEVDLAWTDNSVGEDGFYIERSDDGGSTWSQIDTLGPDSNSYADTSVTGGNTYTYRVRAFNSTGDSGNSNTDTAST